MDILDELVKGVEEALDEGYYDWNGVYCERKKRSLSATLTSLHPRPSLIPEVKVASPSLGVIKELTIEECQSAATLMARYGAGISILTEPKRFNGSLERFEAVRSTVDCPLLMKDFIISERQLDTASNLGADAVLIICALSEDGKGYFNLDKMIAMAHKRGLETLVEAHNVAECQQAVSCGGDMIGINNRDLTTLKVDLGTTARILSELDIEMKKPVISESGFKMRADVERYRDKVDGILVGSVIMDSISIEKKLRELRI